MDFRLLETSRTDLLQRKVDALVIVLCGERAATKLPKALAVLLEDALAGGDLRLEAGQSLYVHRPAALAARRLVFAVAADAGARAIRNAAAAAFGQLKSSGVKHAALALAGAAWSEAVAEAVVLAAADSVYVYRHTKPGAPAAPALARLSLWVDKAAPARRGMALGQAVAAGVALARECANRPANHATPAFLASEARRLGREFDFDVQVLERPAIEKLGMRAFMAVAQGSDQAPKFIVVRYRGAAKSKAPIVLVGKGITFDSGGISIKPSAEMDEMKFDMSGAASTLGTLRAIGELRPKVNLVVLIPACENLPSGRALKPGDVVTSMSGKTVEVLNTDAEGRLILCDALTYAERFDPAAVIDIATLTGACVIALGHHRSGLFSPDDELAAQLARAGDAALDPCWRMPLDAEYDEVLKSNFADMANVGSRAGGSVTAAKFLQRFTAKVRWAHLDIAGIAWKSGAAKGATGRPVPLLTHFVLAQAD